MTALSDLHEVRRTEIGRADCHERAPEVAEVSGDSVVVPLRSGREVEVVPARDGAQLRVRDEAGSGLEIEIRFEAAGPVVRVTARTLELEAAEHITTRCETFSVHAREHIEMRSDGTIVHTAKEQARMEGRSIELDASPGAVRVKANDEVQLLGEMILLNCGKPKPQPDWVERRTIAPKSTLPVQDESGDSTVIEELLGVRKP
jgi:hypothetical protein